MEFLKSMLQQTGLQPVLWFYFNYAIISLGLAVFIWFMQPDKFRAPKKGTIAYLFLLNLLFPIIGFIILFVMGFYFYRLKPKEILANSKQLQSTELGTDNVILTRKFGVGGAALRLKNTKLTPNSRMEALLALSSFLHPQSNRLLTECLGDNTDEIRLLAFSKLETQERTINNKISNFEKKLVHVDNDKQRALILKNIALLYMELIYQGLSPDFLVEKKLLKALQYLKQAKIIDPEDGTIDSYIGLVYFKMQNYEIAEEFFLNAMGKNVFELKYLPYLAEIYFIKRDFNKVHAILAKLKQYEHIPNIGPIIRFWRKNA